MLIFLSIATPLSARVIFDSIATPEEMRARVECDRANISHKLPNYGNFYTGGVDTLVDIPHPSPALSTLPREALARSGMKSLQCSLLYLDWNRLIPHAMIPIYIPQSDDPIAFWFFYEHTDTGKVESSYAQHIDGVSSLLWFRSGLFVDTKYMGNLKDSYDRRSLFAPPVGQYGMEAYNQSLEEPFRSAPMLQMYYYMGKPLLVARDASGEVQAVYFQQRRVDNPMERAKLYLGEKWYHPRHSLQAFSEKDSTLDNKDAHTERYMTATKEAKNWLAQKSFQFRDFQELITHAKQRF